MRVILAAAALFAAPQAFSMPLSPEMKGAAEEVGIVQTVDGWSGPRLRRVQQARIALVRGPYCKRVRVCEYVFPYYPFHMNCSWPCAD